MDDFCRAHQIPYDGECPECAILAMDIIANRAWKADEYHTGDAPDTYKAGFRDAMASVQPTDREYYRSRLQKDREIAELHEKIANLESSLEGEQDLRKKLSKTFFPIREAVIDADRMLDADIHIQSGSPWHERIKKYLKQ